MVYPENRDEFEQKGTKDTKRTTGNSKPVQLWGEAIRGTFFYGSALLCVLCALLFNFPFSRLGLTFPWHEQDGPGGTLLPQKLPQPPDEFHGGLGDKSKLPPK